LYIYVIMSIVFFGRKMFSSIFLFCFFLYCFFYHNTWNIYSFLFRSRASFFVFAVCPICRVRSFSLVAGRRVENLCGKSKEFARTNRPETAGSCTPEISKRCFTRRLTYPGFPFLVGGETIISFRSVFIPYNFLRAHVRSKNWTSGWCLALYYNRDS